MAATHTIEEETTIDAVGCPTPTPEAFGACGICCGAGTIGAYHENTGRYLGEDPCGHCDGDGKSVREEGA